MPRKVKVTRTVEVTYTYDVDETQPGVPSAEEEAEDERTMPEPDAIEQVVIELTEGDGGNHKLLSTQVEIIPADS